MDSLIVSIIHRPYVFAFLAAYLFLAWRKWGRKRAIVWLVSGYFIAWASEYSSIHNGFPYGEYHYIYENMPGELMILGVPFFDSLSYPFLIFASYAMAEFILKGSRGMGQGARLLLGALLTMLLDVIVDPIATMGDKWFLGQIHWYAHPGWYFGVPLSNFAGWLLVAFAVIAFNVILWRAFPFFFKERSDEGKFARTFEYIYPLFYISIALFNIAITFWVGEWKLGIASSCVLALVFVGFFHFTKNPIKFLS